MEEIEFLDRELLLAYKKARKGKRETKDEFEFEINLERNLINLRNDIYNRRYKPSPGIAFVVDNPVYREIFAAPFRDRVVHHFLYNMVYDWWDRRFIYDSYSCRVGKGVLFGVERLAKMIRKVSKGYRENAYIIKLDLAGYFMSLPREGLYERVVWGLDRQFVDKGFVYEICKFLWREVIFDDPTIGVVKRGSEKEWSKVPDNKSLFCQPKGKGIVIGNLSSQLLSNIYLDLLDRYVVYNLGYKNYGRYVDDFFIVVSKEEYEQALRDIKAIENYLERIGLKLHERKRWVNDMGKGVKFLGMVVKPGRIMPGRRLSKNMRKAVERLARGEGEIESIISYFGHMVHIDSYKIAKEILAEFGLD